MHMKCDVLFNGIHKWIKIGFFGLQIMEHMKKFMSGNGGNCPTQISSMWVFIKEMIYDTYMSYFCTYEQLLYA